MTTEEPSLDEMVAWLIEQGHGEDTVPDMPVAWLAQHVERAFRAAQAERGD